MIATKPVKPLNPRSADTNAMGMEPTWKTQPTEGRISALAMRSVGTITFTAKKMHVR